MPVSSLWSGPIKSLKRNLLSSLIPLSLHFLPLTEVAESWAGRARQSAGGSLSHDVPDGRPQRAESPEETAAGETRGRSVRKGTWVHVFWQDLHWCQMLYGFSQRCRPLQIGLFCLVFCWVVLNSRIFFAFQVRVVVDDSGLCFCVPLLNIFGVKRALFMESAGTLIKISVSVWLDGSPTTGCTWPKH